LKRRRAISALVLAAALPACQTSAPRPPAPPGSSPLGPAEKGREEEPLVVKKAAEDVVVAAWSEPRHLAPGGGQAQILIRAQRKGGQPYPGVEVRLRTSTGELYSSGRVLLTDGRGMTRDRLTTRKSAEITMNAGGTRYRFVVPVLPASPE
jgi:hypothetical protein